MNHLTHIISFSLFTGMRGVEREVFLDIKRGVEAKSYEEVSRTRT